LRGAPPVVVIVLFAPDAPVERLLRPLGGSVEAIRNRVQLRLRIATIPVFSLEEAKSAKLAYPGALQVNVLATCDGTEVCSLFFDVQFLQRAFLERIDAPPGLYATWTRSNGVMVGQARLNDAWLTLDQIVDAFANQWLAANPKR